ncbi:hypothetical protein OK349_19080 [Sphingomonas sp. BT-65]|uniref:hypothetical protein n=1 Tax=Sphingomonas sp. BT-65 TaxID=2989821 RepID=UPI0022354A6C|nr:hypothetical protein [Sphingomonas sp. BT-65]MCW4463814.1 hypothetical protein [Sphingomonas sp. BT-65]
MSQDEVITSMGDPQRITKSRNGHPILWYDGFNVMMEDEALVEVGFDPKASVSICDIDPFSSSDAFAKLCKLDGNPCEVLGTIVLRDLGVSLGGFHDNDESQKAITAFAHGRWDILEAKMKPFPLPF